MNDPERVMGNLAVAEFMNRDVLAAQAEWSLDQLAQFFVDNYISGAPVVSERGKLVGVVSVTDIVRHKDLIDRNTHRDVTHDYYVRGLENQYAREEMASLRIDAETPATVQEIMTPMIFEVSEDTIVREVADMMLKGHIHRVFVTRHKEIVGVVTALDMLRIIRDM